MHTVILLDFIDVFCMYVDFYYCPFRHFNAGPMTLPTDVMWQCHHYVGQYIKVNTKGITPYHSLPNYTFSFNLLGVIFYTPVCEGVCLWWPMQLWPAMHFRFGKGVGTKIT